MLKCYREKTPDGWWCVNDITSCLYNDGCNECTHPGESAWPLEEDPKESEAQAFDFCRNRKERGVKST